MFFKKKKELNFNDNKINDKVILKSLQEMNNNRHEPEKFLVFDKKNKKTIIEIKNLDKSFVNFQVFKNLNLNFYENQNVAILGSNGAGKTTLVEIIAGIQKKDKGIINYFLNQTNCFQEKIGIQFQDSNYPKGLNVKDVIDFSLEIFKCELSKDEFNALLKIFGIDKFYFKKASNLSGGQSQRLNCLLSIIHKPSFLILDELSTGLDVSIKTEIKKFMKDYSNNNKASILLVSHDVDEIEYLCERIIIMRHGQIYVDASLNDINKKFGSLSKCIDNYIN